MNIVIRRAKLKDKIAIVKFIDSSFTKEGFGFVSSGQIETEIRRKNVLIALDSNLIIGVRVGIIRVYNLSIHIDYRRLGIGSSLIQITPPETIRVKANPVGHLSKKQLTNFKSPREFYEKLGFEFDYYDYARNFWSGQKNDKRLYFSQSKKKHIEVYRNKSIGQKSIFDNIKGDTNE